MKVVAANRHEIWISLALALLAVVFSTPMPVSYGSILVLVGCLIVSLCCAVNALLDLQAMSIPGKFFTVIWLAVIFVATGWVLYEAAGIRDFANK